jgi:hypothetical protein
MSGPARVAALAVGALVIVAVVVLVLGAVGVPIGLGGDPVAGSASASASASAHPSNPSDEPQPSEPAASASPVDGDELLALLAEIEEEVEALRGLPPADIGDPDIITRAQLRDELLALFDEEYPPEDRERDNQFLRAFGLLTPEQDVAELQLQLLGDSVLGFYDDIDKRMVVVSDAGLDVEARITYAHEYTHALQDAAFGLDALETDTVGEDDRSLARVTLIEGDATVTMLAWAFANLSQEELQEYALGAQVPDTTGIPGWMVDQLAFPYETGLTWVGALAGNPLAPDFSAIDAAFEEPPDSTEQVMDETLEAWQEREAPAEVDAPDVAGVLGDGWTEVEATTIGMATIQIVLEYFGAPGADASAAATGWDGDRASVAYGPDGAFAMGWRVVLESEEDASQLASAYESATADLPFPVAVEAEGSEVLIVHGSADDIVRRVVSDG